MGDFNVTNLADQIVQVNSNLAITLDTDGSEQLLELPQSLVSQDAVIEHGATLIGTSDNLHLDLQHVVATLRGLLLNLGDLGTVNTFGATRIRFDTSEIHLELTSHFIFLLIYLQPALRCCVIVVV